MLKEIIGARNTIRIDMSKMLLKLLGSQAVIGVRSGVAWASRIAERAVYKVIASESVVVRDSEQCGKTRRPGSTSTAVDIARKVL